MKDMNGNSSRDQHCFWLFLLHFIVGASSFGFWCDSPTDVNLCWMIYCNVMAIMILIYQAVSRAAAKRQAKEDEAFF
jgi:hypothetical protein